MKEILKKERGEKMPRPFFQGVLDKQKLKNTFFFSLWTHARGVQRPFSNGKRKKKSRKYTWFAFGDM